MLPGEEAKQVLQIYIFVVLVLSLLLTTGDGRWLLDWLAWALVLQVLDQGVSPFWLVGFPVLYCLLT